jgi:RNA polymerase sigma factor (sigma-70 family)
MNEEWQTRHTLLLRVKDKDDQTAWEEFVFYYEPFIKVVLGFLNVAESDKDDLNQEILLKLWKSLQTFEFDEEKGRFRSWLKTIIRNNTIDYFRKTNKSNQKNLVSLDDNFDSLNLGINDETLSKFIDDEWKTHITHLAMTKVKKSFSGNAIQVFEMSLEGKSAEEIAEKLEISPNSISKLRRRVEEKLIREIAHIRKETEF